MTDGYTSSTVLTGIIRHLNPDANIKYIGVMVFPRAQIDISSVDVSLTPDGGHSVKYKLQKPYCDESGKLCEVFVYKD